MVEDAAYRRLLDVYYTREAPLPLERKAVQKLARAQSKDERAAVDYVLEEFFVQHDDGWHQARCDEEIAKYLAKAPRAAEKRESAKERQQRARERRAVMFAELRDVYGVTASWDTKTCDLETLLSQAQERARHAPVTRDDTATQSPVPRHQVNPPSQSAALTEPKVAPATGAPPLAGEQIDPVTARAIELAALLRQRGASLTATNPDVRRWAAEGVTDGEALQALEIAQQRRADRADPSPIPAGYITPILADLRTPPPGGGARASPAEQRRQKQDQWLDELLPNHRRKPHPVKDLNDERTLDAETPRRLG